MGNNDFLGSEVLVHCALVVCYRVVADGQDFVIMPTNSDFIIAFSYCLVIVGIYGKVSLLLSANIAHG